MLGTNNGIEVRWKFWLGLEDGTLLGIKIGMKITKSTILEQSIIAFVSQAISLSQIVKFKLNSSSSKNSVHVAF